MGQKKVLCSLFLPLQRLPHTLLTPVILPNSAQPQLLQEAFPALQELRAPPLASHRALADLCLVYGRIL